MITSAIIDTREPAHIQALTFGNVPTVAMALDAGDVLCATDDACQILIERKLPGDFMNTLAAGRLFPQCVKMITVTPWSYIVIPGQFYRMSTGMIKTKGRETGWNYDAVQGAILTCQEMGVGVIHCADRDFEQAVIRLCNRDRSTVRIKPPREAYMLRDGEAALAALPGIGTERVQALAKELGSVASILEWLTNLEDKHQVPGVADGTKRAVKKALGLEGELLKVIPWTAQESSYTPNGGFIAAGDKLAMQYLEEVSKRGE